MNKSKLLLTGGFLFVFAFCLVAGPAFAVDQTITIDSVVAGEVVLESNALSSEPEKLDGIIVEEPKSIPSGLGFWWKNLTESVSLGLTFDPVKKAEKQLKFAEEKTKLAQYIIENSKDPKLQERAQKMLDKAGEYAKKIEEKKADFINKKDEVSKRLLENIARHQLNKEKVLDRIEDKIPADKLEQFIKMREGLNGDTSKFLQNLKDDANVPQEVKDQITDRVLNIEKIQNERIIVRKSLLDQLNEWNRLNPDKDSKLEFEKLRQERAIKAGELQEELKVKRLEIINKIEGGDKTAVEELKKLNQEQRTKVEEFRREANQRAMDVRRKGEDMIGDFSQIKNGSDKPVRDGGPRIQKGIEEIRLRDPLKNEGDGMEPLTPTTQKQ